MKAILTRNLGNTHQAQILSTKGTVQFKATCTAGEDMAAKALVQKYYGTAAADSIELCPGKHCTAYREAKPFREKSIRTWTLFQFNPLARHIAKAS